MQGSGRLSPEGMGELIRSLQGAAVEDIQARLMPLTLGELASMGRALGVSFSRTPKGVLVTELISALRRDVRMTAVEEAARKAFSK